MVNQGPWHDSISGADLDRLPTQEIVRQGVRWLQAFGRHDLADTVATQTLLNFDSTADTHGLLADIFDRRGDWQCSLAHLHRAHALMPNASPIRINLALALLRLGNYREGFSLYEARIDKPAWSGFATADSRAVSRRLLLRPDDAVAGRRIVVLAEQGLGDCIMFSRYIPMLAKRGARIALACNPSLRPFLERIPGIETLLSPPPDQPLAQINLTALAFDAWVPLMSLPYFFGTDASSIPAAIPYWSPDAARVAEWRSYFAKSGRPGTPKVGLVFRANPLSGSHAERSLAVSDLLPLLESEAVDVVNLQHGPAGRELAAVAPGIIDPFQAEVPLDEFGAVVAATDLLISVDTMAAHCAGAMGHPTWVAVPFSPHWAWVVDQATTPWYPSARLFRQATPGDWSAAIAELAAALNGLEAGPSAAARPQSGEPRQQRQKMIVNNASVPLDQSVADDQQALQYLAQMGRALLTQGQVDAARTVASIALHVDASCADCHDLMGDVLEELGDRNTALDHRRKAALLGAASYRLKLGLTQLAGGDFAHGFNHYEARRELPFWIEQALPLPASVTAMRERQLRPGDPVRGRHILVFTEQGLDDSMFGARFLPLLAKRSAEITLVCRAPMRPFFARLQCCNTILSAPDASPHAKINLERIAFDAFCPLLSLPYALGLEQSEPASSAPYLSADPGLTAAWRARYAREGRAGRRKVGLVWQANPSNRVLAHRSMLTTDLAPLASVDDVDLINLQHGPSGRELARVIPEMIDAIESELTLDEFAAALAATDLVISVDTMAAHCAAASGHRVWVALPPAPSWYWGREENACGWYPTARPFRQAIRNDWSSVVAAMVASLQDDDEVIE